MFCRQKHKDAIMRFQLTSKRKTLCFVLLTFLNRTAVLKKVDNNVFHTITLKQRKCNAVKHSSLNVTKH